MEQKTNDEFMRNILVEEAWKDLSLGFAWSEPLLEKYQDRVSWEDISLNPYIRWTIPMVGKFSKRINWRDFLGVRRREGFDAKVGRGVQGQVGLA